MNKQIQNKQSIIFKRLTGSFIGCAIGDSLGLPIEFVDKPKDLIITELLGNSDRNIDAGDWSDDTSMTLCLGTSILENDWDLNDQLSRYKDWLHEGYMCCKQYSFGSGGTTRKAIEDYINTGSIINNKEFERCGNGSLMRISPIVWGYFHQGYETVVDLAGKSSITTHAHPICIGVCRLAGSLLYNIINGVKLDRLYNTLKSVDLEDLYQFDTSGLTKQHLTDVINCDYSTYDPYSLSNVKLTAFAPETLKCALYALFNSKTFEQGMIKAVNIPGDSDTIGAIYGYLAGAYYNIDNIPERWGTKLNSFELIVDFCERFIHYVFHYNNLILPEEQQTIKDQNIQINEPYWRLHYDC